MAQGFLQGGSPQVMGTLCLLPGPFEVPTGGTPLGARAHRLSKEESLGGSIDENRNVWPFSLHSRKPADKIDLFHFLGVAQFIFRGTLVLPQRGIATSGVCVCVGGGRGFRLSAYLLPPVHGAQRTLCSTRLCLVTWHQRLPHPGQYNSSSHSSLRTSTG